MRRLISRWRRRGERRRAEHPRGYEHRCSVCAGFEAAIWELQQRGYPTTTTEEEYRLHRLQKHSVSKERAGRRFLTYPRVVIDQDAP